MPWFVYALHLAQVCGQALEAKCTCAFGFEPCLHHLALCACCDTALYQKESFIT